MSKILPFYLFRPLSVFFKNSQKTILFIQKKIFNKPVICCFGASVTQQKNGYVKHLKREINDFLIIQKGFGSMHLNDAGMIFMDDVLKWDPEYCFIDWTSTGFIADYDAIKIYIETIIRKFTQKKCKLIFLFIPEKSKNLQKTKMHQDCKRLLAEYGIFYLDLSLKFDNLDDILYDSVHTTREGSRKYAKYIADFF